MGGFFMHRFLIALIVMMAFACISAQADILRLPQSLSVIDDEAFMGDTSLDEVFIPGSVLRIGDSAFANSSASVFYLPNFIMSVGSNAFPPSASLYADAGSRTERTLNSAGYAIAQEATDAGEFTFDVIDGKAVITAYTGTEASITLPAYDPEGRPITVIQAFESSSPLESIVIPTGVLEVADNAFKQKPFLRSVVLPDTLQKIGDYAFYGCSGLLSIDIPASVYSIGEGCFSKCTELSSVTFAENASLQRLEDEAFYRCTSLQEIVFPASLQKICMDTCLQCYNLQTVIIPEGVTEIGAEAFLACSKLQHLELPQSLTTIGISAFSNCSSLTAVTIYNNVHEIGNGAFCVCTKLTTFSTLNAAEKGYFEKGNIGDAVFSGCTALSSVTLPNNFKSMGGGVFNNCTSLTEFHIPYGVETLNDYYNPMFLSCYNMKDIFVPDTVVEIKNPDQYGSVLGLTSNITIYAKTGSAMAQYVSSQREIYNSKNNFDLDVQFVNTALNYTEDPAEDIHIDPLGDVLAWVGTLHYPNVHFTDGVDRTYTMSPSNSVVSAVRVDGQPAVKVNELGASNITVQHGATRLGTFSVYGALSLKCDGLELSDTPLRLGTGYTRKLRIDAFDHYAYTVMPGAAEWKSLDPDICTVDDDGNITGIREGNARIAVSVPYTLNNSLTGQPQSGTTSMSCAIMVRNPEPFTVDAETLYIGVGETVDLKPSKGGKFLFVSDSTGTAQPLSQTSPRIKGKGAGKATITVTSLVDGASAQITLRVLGNGFSYKKYLDLQDLEAARKNGATVVKKAVNSISQTQATTIKTIEDKIDMYIALPSDLPAAARKAFLDVFHGVVESFKFTVPTNYTDAGTEAALIKMIANNLKNQNGELKFTASVGGRKLAYTCVYKEIGAFGANLQIGYIQDENGHKYDFMATQTDGKSIKKEMSYLKELADTKIADVKDAAFSDAKSLLNIDEAANWLKGYVGSKAFDTLKDLYPLQKSYISDVQQAISDLKSIKNHVSALKIDLKGSNIQVASDWINEVSTYHEKLEAYMDAVDALIR